MEPPASTCINSLACSSLIRLYSVVYHADFSAMAAYDAFYISEFLKTVEAACDQMQGAEPAEGNTWGLWP